MGNRIRDNIPESERNGLSRADVNSSLFSSEEIETILRLTKVDWVISAVIIPEESSGWWRYEPYFFSRNDIADCRGRIVDYATFQFLESNPNISETVFNIARLKHHGCGVNSEVSKE